MSRILFLSCWFPYPPDNGSKLRISNLLQGLASKHEITLVSFVERGSSNLDVATAHAICHDIYTVPVKPFDPENRRARLGFLSPTPRSIIDTYSPEMGQCVRQILATEKYDLIIASQLGTAVYASCFGDTPALFEEVEVGLMYEQFAKAKTFSSRIRHGLTWVKHRRYLARLLRYFRACTVVSDQERQLLQQCAPAYPAIKVIPNCIHLKDYSDVRVPVQANTLIYTGSFRYFANYEAMVWFLRKVFPRIQAQIPDVRLTITGDHANLPLPVAQNVNLTGFVEDVRPWIASAAVSLAPLQQGGGTRLKILEAMALRSPVVATSKGAEGLAARHNEHLLIADSPEVFAQEIIRLLREPQLRQRLADNAYQFVRENYDWAVVMPQFMGLVGRIAQV